MTYPLTLSVIVPVWNGEKEIRTCLEALENQTLSRDMFEIIVVDNGSQDATVSIVQEFVKVKLLHEPAPGSYTARNTGLAVASAEYVAFTDADCIPNSDWLENALAHLQKNPDVGILAGRIELFRSAPNDSKVCAAYEQLFFLNQQRYAKDGWCATANWISRRALIAQFGGFNANLKSGGDRDLSKRITNAGNEIQYVHDAVVRHPTRGGIPDVIKKRRRVVGGQWTKRGGKSVVSFVWDMFHDAVRSSAFILLKGPRNLKMKAGLVFLIGAVLVSNITEAFRLWLGGEPRRA